MSETYRRLEGQRMCCLQKYINDYVESFKSFATDLDKEIRTPIFEETKLFQRGVGRRQISFKGDVFFQG